MNNRALIRIAILLIVGLVGYLQKDRFLDAPTGDSGKPGVVESGNGPGKADPPPAPEKPSSGLVVRDLRIRDIDGRIAYEGDVDLAPALARIEAGQRDPHENDGAIFGNRERKLPQKQRGYYREYVVRTPGIRHAGPQRLVIGRGDEVYYTPDHYRSFRRITP